MDHRLRVFSHHAYLFQRKDILDIGCNIGHITLCVARDFRARTVTGIDIDPKLIGIARKNVKHYVKTEESPPQIEDTANERTGGTGDTKSSEFFPISMPILYGAIDVPGFHDLRNKGKGFPNNVTFKQVSAKFVKYVQSINNGVFSKSFCKQLSFCCKFDQLYNNLLRIILLDNLKSFSVQLYPGR